MRQVQSNAELASLHAAGAGMVFNFFTKSGSDANAGQYNVLHSVNCPWVKRMLAGAELTVRPTVNKIFLADAAEAEPWLTEHVGQESVRWKRCNTCLPSAPNARGPQGMAPAPSTVLATPNTSPRPPSSGPTPMISGFSRPEGPAIELPVQPRLASWNASIDPEQRRLKLYLERTDELLRPRYESLAGPLALRLDVALQPNGRMLEARDLDNYLYPLAKHIQKPSHDRITSVWGTKQTGGRSLVRIEVARPLPPRAMPGNSRTVETSASPETKRYKEHIRDQVSDATLLPDGPVRLEIYFTVGQGRNWLPYWKPSIDALGQILGHSPQATEWSPRDGRIVELALHRHIDAALGATVRLTVAAALATSYAAVMFNPFPNDPATR